MDVLLPQNIEDVLNNRLNNTLNLYKTLDTDDTQIYNIIYFRLFFDFSTAIEKTIHDIMFTKYGSDDFIIKKSKIDSKSISDYLPKEEIKLLVGEFGKEITVGEIKQRFQFLEDIIKPSFFLNLNLERKVYDVEPFTSVYQKSRDTRNKLAHGLVMSNVEFNNRMLFNFMVSYYVLITFYQSLCK